jgi:hypothetical protein
MMRQIDTASDSLRVDSPSGGPPASRCAADSRDEPEESAMRPDLGALFRGWPEKGLAPAKGHAGSSRTVSVWAVYGMVGTSSGSDSIAILADAVCDQDPRIQGAAPPSARPGVAPRWCPTERGGALHAPWAPLVSFWLLAVLPLLFAASCAVIFHAEWKRRRSEYWQSKLDESGSAGTRTRLLLVLGGLIAYGAGAFLTQLVYDDLARRLFGSQ